MSDDCVSVQAKTDVQAGDDDFEVYRKRMMLGYKHRWVALRIAKVCMHGSVPFVHLIKAGATQASFLTACFGRSVLSAECAAEACCCFADQIPWAIPESNTTPEDGGHRISMGVHDGT